MVKETKVVSNTNWKAVKAGAEFMVTEEIRLILEKKNYIGEVIAPVAEVVTETEPTKPKK